MLKKRVATAVLLLPLVVVVVWFNEPVPLLAVFAAIWGVLAAWEFYRAVTNSGQKVPPLTAFGLLLTLLFIISPLFDYHYLNLILLTSAVVLPAILFLVRCYTEGTFAGWAWTVAGILCIGWLLSHFVALRELDSGRDWVLFALFVTFASDSAAYFVGSAIGKHRLAPGISPKKTWEGAAGGVAGAIGVGLLLIMLLNLPVSYIQAVPLAIAVSIFGQFGDLLESLFKRRVGIKDSGKAMPGHGGFLDRMDSVAFAGAFVYYNALLLYNG
ncbi:MAG: phosphatidate cytidylyltransferase [Dehalococcoidales bacterium]|nr:phosphatidate cytidylyltransferase [Dehalococcoidales bacterium]